MSEMVVHKFFKRHAYDELKSKTEVKKAKRFIKEIEENGIDYCLYNEREDVGYLIRNKKIVAHLSKSSFYHLTKCSFKHSFKNCIVIMCLDPEEVKDFVVDFEYRDEEIEICIVETETDSHKCTCDDSRCASSDWSPINIAESSKDECDYKLAFYNTGEDYSIHIDSSVIKDIIRNIVEVANKSIQGSKSDIVIVYDTPDADIITDAYSVTKIGDRYELSKSLSLKKFEPVEN